MKQSFKRAGVAVLSMAMLLSMGAIGATSVSAAGESIKVEAGTGLKDGDAVKVYKVAAQDGSNVWNWTSTTYGTAAGVDFATIDGYTDNSAEVKALAAKLARVAATADATGSVGTAIDVSAKGAGYYLVVAAPSDAGKVAQPILLEVDGAETVTDTKVSDISLTKKITKVMEKTTDKTSTNVQDTGKNAQAKAGDVVTYRIVAQIPAYDSSASSIQDFVLTDKSDATLTSCAASGFKVIIGTTAEATTGDDVSSCLTRTDGQNFTVTLPGSTTVKDNGGKYLIVEFTATVGDNPTLSKNLGPRANQADTAKGADANKNDVTLTYGNNYSTGSRFDTDGDGDVDNDDDQPELKDYADVYATALYIDKTLDGTAAAADDVGFELWEGTTKVRNEVKTDSNGRVSFKGLDAGTYTLKETTGKAGFKMVNDIDVTISSESPYATFSATSGWTLEADGGYAKTVDNPPTESLPGTGGMGTVLFTVGGAAVVLLAGAMFVVYMRKRKVEE